MLRLFVCSNSWRRAAGLLVLAGGMGLSLGCTIGEGDSGGTSASTDATGGPTSSTSSSDGTTVGSATSDQTSSGESGDACSDGDDDCPSFGCVDLQTHPYNCGACGIGCAAFGDGACIDGVCSAGLGPCFNTGVAITCDMKCDSDGAACVEAGCDGSTVILYGSDFDACDARNPDGDAQAVACDDPLNQDGVQIARCCCRGA